MNVTEEDVRRIFKSMISETQYKVLGVPFHAHNGVDSGKIPYLSLNNAPGYFIVATDTNGVTPVNVMTGNQVNMTITGVFLISKDATAGNITLKNNGNTVTTIAKGAVAGVLVGAISLANTAYTAGDPFTVVSSSVGNSTLFVIFSV